MAQSKSQTSWLRHDVLKISGIHAVFVLAYVAQIVIYDAWKLITPEAVLQRWIMIAIVAAVNTIVWYVAWGRATTTATFQKLVFALILADIALASFNVYTQRGMASRAVILYVLPIVLATVLRSRAALLTTAILCIIAYTTTAVSYFVLNFNEGYKIELYGEVTSYCVFFLIVASLLWVHTRRHNR